jgi:acetyltransferase
MVPIIYTSNKPVVIALMGERMIQEAIEYFRAARVPEYRFPERAAGALAILAQRADYLAREQDPPQRFPDVDTAAAHLLLAENQPDGSGFLPQEVTNQLLAAYGLPVPPTRLARTAEEAVAAARELGLPVALKIASPDILHKSDIAGVLLGLGDEDAVRKGFDEIIDKTRAVRPQATLLGTHIQPMVPQGQEVIIGAVQDPQFGPLVMFGSGGVEVEGLQDVDFSLAPLSWSEAEGLLARTWAGRKLRGYRHIPPADREAVLSAIIRLAQLAADFPQLAEIEINPLRVLPAGEGAFAVDGRVRVAHKPES